MKHINLYSGLVTPSKVLWNPIPWLYLMCFFAYGLDEEDVVVVDEDVPALTAMPEQNLTSFVVVLDAVDLVSNV
jgi:hypothetical protein